MKKEILATLVYHRIFEYPLKKEEIWKYLIKTQNSKLKTQNYQDFLETLGTIIKKGLIKENSGFYFLKGDERLVKIRKKRGRWSKKKLEKAKRIANLLKIIPWVKLVGVSGALAMSNSDKNDDIDFFIITAARRLWLTRFWVTILLDLAGQRRKPQRINIKDKICLNTFLDEENLGFKRSGQSLYLAHEIAQMKPLWQREKTYQKFLAVNLWLKKYLPNSIEKVDKSRESRRGRLRFFDSLEDLARNFQINYMKKRLTTEKIEKGRIFFHPEDKRRWVENKLKIKSEKLKI